MQREAVLLGDLTDLGRGQSGHGEQIAPAVTRRLITEFVNRPASAPPRRAPLTGITDREREVLTLVGTGLSNTEIAAELSISVATAKTYMARKLDARDRAQLVILAYETGLVTPS